MSTDRSAGYKLIETGTLVEFEVKDSKVEPSLDGETSFVHVDIQLGGPEGGAGADQVEWGGFGYMFALAVMSFADARPRGYSGKEYVDEDEFTVTDFFDGLKFIRGELHYDGDYIRGRCMKTEIVVRRDGRVTLETRGRGESALRWVERLKGKKRFQLVPMTREGFTAPAASLWEEIPAVHRQRILDNVWCGRCRGSVTITQFAGVVKKGDILLSGKCGTCGHDVARVVETSEAPR